MLTVIVADDEKIARRRLVRLIEETGDAEVVAACAGGREAVKFCRPGAECNLETGTDH